jgi:hypothetical protein
MKKIMHQVRSKTVRIIPVWRNIWGGIVHSIQKTPGFVRGFVISSTLVVVFACIPYLPIGLKALGFMRYDFIPSTSGAVFESNGNLPYRFTLGNTQNETEMHISIFFSDGSVGFSLKGMEKITVQSESIATPSSVSTVTVDTPLAASSSVPSASESGHSALKEAYIELQTIQKSHATLSARIASLSAEIDALLEKEQKIYSEVTQHKTKPARSYNGPIETIRQEGQGIRVSYHREGADVVETITVTNPDIASLVYEIDSPQYAVFVHATQAWDIIRSDAVQMQIVSRIKAGSDAQLGLVEEQQIYPSNAKHSLRFVLPKRRESDRGLEPLVIERRYIRTGVAQVSVEERIRTFVGLDDNLHPIVAAPYIDRIIPTASGAAILYEGEGNRYTTSDDHIDLQSYLGGEPLTALSCKNDTCVAVKNDRAFSFSLTDLRTASKSSEFFQSITGYQLKNPPVGEIALGTDTLLYTSFQSPIGGVFRRDAKGMEERISDIVSFPKHLSVTPDGTGVAYWAEGKIYLHVKGTSGMVLPLDEEPIDLAIGPDYSVYCIIPIISSKTRMIVRISLGLSVEVLPGKTGHFTSLSAGVDGLNIAMTLSDIGILLPIPWEKLTWIPLTWEDTP